MKNPYQKTIYACFTGYIVQAIVNNFAPLLFVMLHENYGIPMEKITLLITFNFGLQLLVDLLSVGFVDRIGYRASVVLAHVLAAAGLLSMTVLPGIFGDPFTGLLVSVIIYAVGGGLLEVLVSPVMESCPSDNKEKAMSLLHSFYCWGHVGVVLISTVFFRAVGIGYWPVLAGIWALIPLINAAVFTKVPIAPLMEEGEKGIPLRQLVSMKMFWGLLIMMVCAGASEQAVSQWASSLAESSLGLSKTAGDLAGPMMFAVMMGLGRAFYGKKGDQINLEHFMKWSGMLCIISYLLIAFSPIASLGLAGCALCGLSVGIMWPGTFSIASAAMKRGGTALFALLALGGDVGCSLGPTVAGQVSGWLGDDLRAGILAAIIFPVMLLAALTVKGNVDKARAHRVVTDEAAF